MTTEEPAPRRGRRPAGQDARAEIVRAARVEFLEKGYDAVSLRSVARRAGVDPGTVRHWFGDKRRLLPAALGLADLDPGTLVRRALAGPVDSLGERLVRAALELWDADGGAVRVVLPAILADPSLRGLLPQFLGAEVLGPLTAAVADGGGRPPADDAPLRVSLVASQMVGMLMARYVVGVEPLASASPETVAGLVGPTIQRYLTGDLAAAAIPGAQPLAPASRQEQNSPHEE